MSSQKYIEYPLEKFYQIENHNDLILRLTIGLNDKLFWVESDLVTMQGRKILRHLGRQQNIESLFDATQVGLNFYHSFK